MEVLVGQPRLDHRREHRSRPHRLDPPLGFHDDPDLWEADPETLRYGAWLIPPGSPGTPASAS
jgi:hypothetical protein